MPKQKPDVRIRTYGIYSKWDSDSKELPSFQRQTDRILAKVDVEFGLIINVTGGKNLPLSFCIDHPGILDDQGKRRPPFEDVVYVKSNDWDFFLGDTIWEPIDDKLGPWRMTMQLQGKTVVDQTFELYAAPRRGDATDRLRHRYRLLRISLAAR
ncbi:DUF3859 domain-containing protein [Stieleria sp. TO1_6]|uniref:DUF3859 domain-containing protein n=1 Tax=Stieleria tagensis TaxID=2956795 RepID=UPI00209B9FC4|nr:DUF3859 domain-containing protein [Stieleria tagensis]MCO8122248.1 DUF3859 domain-containing protein [Stieleria tagensis]